MFTCIVCENHYHHLNGDTDERMCHKCLDTSDMLDDLYKQQKKEKENK